MNVCKNYICVVRSLSMYIILVFLICLRFTLTIQLPPQYNLLDSLLLLLLLLLFVLFSSFSYIPDSHRRCYKPDVDVKLNFAMLSSFVRSFIFHVLDSFNLQGVAKCFRICRTNEWVNGGEKSIRANL